MILEELKEKFKRITGYDPYYYQEKVWQAIIEGNNVVISAGTGAGKTEAAVLPALETGKRLILLYPTKALLQDQLARIQKLASSQSIAVDTGDEDDLSYYHADIILTNLDKFLYRMFGYGKRRFSYLFPYRIAGMGDNRKPLLIFDEAHAYEETIFTHFWFVLKKLTYERQVQTVLLSATLPQNLVEALRDPQCKYFPRLNHEGDFFNVVEDKEIRSGQVFFKGFKSSEEAITHGWKAYQEGGKRVIVVVRRVVNPAEDEDGTGTTLHSIWETLVGWASQAGKEKELAHLDGEQVAGSILTYHGHQLSSYRRLVLDRLKKLDDAKRPYLILTTSAMEVGVDVSCNVMITDLCEPDSFVQRIGRCARRNGETGEVYVIDADPAPPRTAALRDYLQKLSANTELCAKRKAEINAMNKPPQLDTVHLRLEYVQDVALYRYVYDFVQENRALWEQGVLITREWEPAIPVVRSEKRDGAIYIGGIPEREFWRGKEIKEKTLLPVSCAADIAPFCAWIFDTFNEEFHHPQRIPVGGKQERSLGEVLQEAGYSVGGDGDKPKPLYAVGLPMILLLGDKVVDRVLKDDNFGFAYGRQFVKPTVRAPSPLLRVRQVELRKDKGQVKLPLYWYEPVEEGGE
ncbi:MAG: DEAD/DEAH box helicase [Candidatus Methanomethylicaceae archaeon]